MRQRGGTPKRRFAAALLGLLTAGTVLTAPPAGAENISAGSLSANGASTSTESGGGGNGGSGDDAGDGGGPAPSCAVELDIELVNLDHVHDDGAHVDHRVSAVIDLPAPVSGRVLTSGVTTDLDHLEDEIDFTTEKSQFEEQVRVVFLNAAGHAIATTEATPDLPDIAPFAPFALPSVDLSEPAVAIQVVHAATGDGFNSIGVPCINVKEVGPDSAPAEYLNFGPCPIDGLAPPPPDATCGFLAVPENRDVEGSRLINVAFAILPGDGSKPDPLVYLEGGPGFGPIWVSSLIHADAMGPVSGGRDVIYVDQRGTGYSQPSLQCEGQADYLEVPYETFDEFLEFVRQCGADLQATGADLNGYTTIQNGHDIADLRIALGIAEWNIFGGSYGTDLGLTIMRDRPEGIRSVILDSVYPPEVTGVSIGGTINDDGIGFLNELDAIVERCASDPVCDGSFPNVRSDIIAAVSNLNSSPVVASGTEAEFIFGTPELPIDGTFLLDLLNAPGIHLPANPLAPALLNGLAQPDPSSRTAAMANYLRAEVFRMLGLPPEIAEELKAAYRGVPGETEGFAEGFNMTVVCAEEIPYADPATSYTGPGWSAEIDEYAGQFYLLYELTCEAFGVEPADPVVAEPVESDIETLVLYTDVDYQTWPEWSELAASRLTNAQLVFFPNLAHVVTFRDPCPQYVVSQFLDRPGGLVDTSCAADLPPIYYEGELPAIDPLPPIDELFAKLDELFGPPDGEAPPEGDEPPAEGSTAPVATGTPLSSGTAKSG